MVLRANRAPLNPPPHTSKLLYPRSPRAHAPSMGGLSPGPGPQKAQDDTDGQTEVGWGTHTEDLELPTSTRQDRPHFCQPWGHMDHCICSGVGSGSGVGALIIPRAQGSMGLLVGQVDQGQSRGPKASADYSGGQRGGPSAGSRSSAMALGLHSAHPTQECR